MSDEATAAADADDSVDGSENPPEQPMAYGAPVTDSRRQVVLHPSVETYIATIEALRADGFISIIDLCGADYLGNDSRSLPDGVTAERYELIVNLISHVPPRRVRLRVQVPADAPQVPTLFDLFPGSENMEREAWDMFGIEFTDHPDPTRILMPADWNGHPLRKDFDVGSVPVQFKGAPAPR